MSGTPQRWRVAWITGASSGLGRDLAVKLARSGTKVAATARSQDKLADLADSQENIFPFPADVTDLNAMRAVVPDILDMLGPIDLAILNAGVWELFGVRTFDAEKMQHAIDVNLSGIANALDPLLPRMIDRKSGHIALISSVAGYRGLPKAMGYSSTKAAVIALAESLRHELDRIGVNVSIVNPGFVDTPMTHGNDFPMPFILTSDEATNRILYGLKKRKYEVAFPWQTNVSMKAARLIPNWLYFWGVRTFMMPPKRKDDR